MIEHLKTWAALKADRRGVTALEYGVIAALILGVCATAFQLLGTTINTALGTLQGLI
jgi:Flp pilus assembly pilin Flp